MLITYKAVIETRKIYLALNLVSSFMIPWLSSGDRGSVEKMREICQRVQWESKEKDIAAKANNCLTCFRSGKNLKTMIPKTEKNPLPSSKTVGKQVQIVFAGPFVNEKKNGS